MFWLDDFCHPCQFALRREMKCLCLFFKTTESVCEVEALMEKMKQLQECRDEEEASQEEMATRFEREKRESMFVCSSGSADVVCIYVYTVPNCLKTHIPLQKEERCRMSQTPYHYFEGIEIGSASFSSGNAWGEKKQSSASIEDTYTEEGRKRCLPVRKNLHVFQGASSKEA